MARAVSSVGNAGSNPVKRRVRRLGLNKGLNRTGIGSTFLRSALSSRKLKRQRGTVMTIPLKVRDGKRRTRPPIRRESRGGPGPNMHPPRTRHGPRSQSLITQRLLRRTTRQNARSNAGVDASCRMTYSVFRLIDACSRLMSESTETAPNFPARKA